MMWIDYSIDSIPGGKGFKVKGDWEGEVMGIAKDGSHKDHYLYRPGDVFIVNEHGWLVKTDEVNTLLKKYEEGKAQKETA
jgi:hypothetical protein|tara:strand:- start:974 stop:1213 length:240 start_codon:yes stop_codon:yes gene_type:complete